MGDVTVFLPKISDDERSAGTSTSAVTWSMRRVETGTVVTGWVVSE